MLMIQVKLAKLHPFGLGILYALDQRIEFHVDHFPHLYQDIWAVLNQEKECWLLCRTDLETQVFGNYWTNVHVLQHVYRVCDSKEEALAIMKAVGK